MTRSKITATLAIAFGLLTGAPPPISYAGAGDFHMTVDKPSATATTGDQVRFKVTFTSVDGFGGEVTPKTSDGSWPSSALVGWSPTHVKLPPHGSAAVVLTIQIPIDTPPGVYQITVQGAGGSVTHVAPAIALTVTPPKPGTITATVSPERPIVGVSEVRISGRASARDLAVIDSSTFPDGITHVFAVDVSGNGNYARSPFVLEQLGTYHDVLLDGATGATVEITYQGVGDFSTSVDRTSATVARGAEAKFEVTFKSLSGFAGRILPAVPDLSRIAGASASWSSPAAVKPAIPDLPLYTPPLMVGSDGSAAATLTIKTSSTTPPGTYKINVQGTNGSVTHAATSEIELTVKE